MIHSLYRCIGNLISPQGKEAQLSILIYHKVLAEIDILFPGEVTANSFNKQLIELKKVFNILPLEEALYRLTRDTLPARAACITFDDGYADNATIALPIIQEHGLTASFFIATAYLNGGRMFNDTIIHAIRHSQEPLADLSKLQLGRYNLDSFESKRQAISSILKIVKYMPLGERESVAAEVLSMLTDIPASNNLMMNTSQLKQLRDAGMTIGGHTSHHPILKQQSHKEAIQEIAEGKEELERILGDKIRYFAYPNGLPGVDYCEQHANMVKSLGFEAALSTRWGTANRLSDIFQLPRFTPYSNNIIKFTPMLFKNIVNRNSSINLK